MGKQALGRGLSAIFKAHDVLGNSVDNAINNTGATENVNTDNQKIVEINIDLIDPNPFQPRKFFDDDELVELAETIEKHGLIQPIAVRKVGDRYQIISGERRTRASKLANCRTIKAQVYDNLDDKTMSEWAQVPFRHHERTSSLEAPEPGAGLDPGRQTCRRCRPCSLQ